MNKMIEKTTAMDFNPGNPVHPVKKVFSFFSSKSGDRHVSARSSLRLSQSPFFVLCAHLYSSVAIILTSFFFSLNLRSSAKSAVPLLLLLCLPALAGQTVRYVDKDNASGTQDGTSWATAYTTIQPAIDAAYNAGGGEVWVAEGVYDEERTFLREWPRDSGQFYNTGGVQLRSGADLYGGFTGTETQLDERNWRQHETILDGSTAREGRAAYNVVLALYEDDVRFDGFTVRGGSASGSVPGAGENGGGVVGLYSNIILSNTIIQDNSSIGAGGGVVWSSGAPVILNCEFRNNVGGGLYINTNQPITIHGCMFVENVGVGALIAYSQDLQIDDCQFINTQGLGLNLGIDNFFGYSTTNTNITNCLFSGNARGIVHSGKVALNPESYPGLSDTASYINCTFMANAGLAGYPGSALRVSALKITIENCILWQNAGVPYYNHWTSSRTPLSPAKITWSNSIIQEAEWTTDDHSPRPVGEGLLFDADPQFVAPALGNYRLHPSSPAIDMGSAVDAPTTDLDGNARPIDIPGVGSDGEGLGHDIGAYEYDPATFKDPYDPNADGATNALDIQEVINAALGLSTTADTDINDDGITNALDIQLIINAALGIY